MAGFFSDLFSGGLFVDSIFGRAGGAGSFDTCAAGVAFGFGASAGGPESVEAAGEGAAAIGAPSGVTVCEAAGAGAGFGGAGVNTGIVVSKPKEAADGAAKEDGRGAATSASPTAASELLFAGAALTPGWVSKAPACGRLSAIGGRESPEGSRVCSPCGLTGRSVARADGSLFGGPEASFILMRTKPAQTVAAPASASPPAVSPQLLGLAGF